MGARPYDPTLGRFLTPDPIQNGSLNDYDYTGQDPINNYDLNGALYGPLGSAFSQATLGAMCAFDPGSCGRTGSLFGTIGRLVSENWRSCASGGVVGSLSGPQDAIAGCLIGVVADHLTHSDSRSLHDVGIAIQAAQGLRDARDLSKAYKDAAQILKTAEKVETVVRVTVIRVRVLGGALHE